MKRSVCIMTPLLCSACLVGIALLPTLLSAAEPIAVKTLHVSPKNIMIGGANRRQQLLITAESPEGTLFDVTANCGLTIADENIISGEGTLLSGVADGTTEIVIQYGGVRKQIPVTVTNFSTYPPISFNTDIIPVFSKLGCNSGGCHGKQTGQNGFRLSIFGSDTAHDYVALVKEARGRRIFAGDPEQSLLITKTIGRVAHGGGQRTAPDSPDHELLVQWIKQGTPWGSDAAPTVTGLKIEPTGRVMRMSADQQILVTAVYSNGSEKDVTDATAYTSNTDVVAEVDQRGTVRTGTIPGESSITVNYMGHVGAVQIMVPRTGGTGSYPELPVNNQVDQLVWAKLRKMGIVPSGLSDDAAFLRRVQLDTIGILPTPAETRAFLADRRLDKRRRKIDELLNRDAFNDYWALKFSDILLVNSETLGERGAYEFHGWLREQFSNNRPYDEWVREIITATGVSGKNGPVNFYRALRTPEDLTRSVSQAFLGVRLDCAQCHHHPFEKWGQEDFYGLAGFFNGIERKAMPDTRELVYHAGYKTTTMPLTGALVPTRPPGGAIDPKIANGDPRVKLAEWLTAKENPWFTKLVANRLWKHYLGRGLVEPEDDLRSTNPATNEPLLDYLAEEIVRSGYDLKAVMRIILSSRVYQLSSVPNGTNYDDAQNFSHYTVKRMPAEVLLDAVSQVTGSPEKYPGMPLGTRTVELWDNRLPSYFLDTFGRSERDSPCECGKSNEPTMTQALHLMNAPEIEAKITNPNGRVAKLLAKRASRDAIVEEICLTALGRMPNEKERNVAKTLFSAESPKQAAEDFLWALLNSYDFLFVR